MSLLDFVFGPSIKSVLRGEITRIAFSEANITGVIHNFPFYYAEDNPSERVQDRDVLGELILNLSNFDIGVDQRLVDYANSYCDYDLSVPVDDDMSLRIEFRFDREDEAGQLVFEMVKLIEEAITAQNVKFITLRN